MIWLAYVAAATERIKLATGILILPQAAAARRAGRLGDGFFPAGASHDAVSGLLGAARAAATDAGRDPDALEVSFGGNSAIGPNALDEVKALGDLGVDRVIVPAFAFWGNPADDLARYGDDVIAKVS